MKNPSFPQWSSKGGEQTIALRLAYELAGRPSYTSVARVAGVSADQVRKKVTYGAGRVNRGKVFRALRKFYRERSGALEGTGKLEATRNDDYDRTIGADQAKPKRTTKPSAPKVKATERAAENSPFQGRPIHQSIQRALVELARIKHLYARTNIGIGAGFRPDVLWYNLDPDKHPGAGFSHVFEIEFGAAGQIAKSLASLKQAHSMGCARLFLIVPSNAVRRVESKIGAFHEIEGDLKVVKIEGDLTNHLVLAEKLEIA